MAIDVRRAAERFHTKTEWLDSWHSFSFGPHHDPANTHHGLLLVNNDDVVLAGRGFGTHPHRDMEIVTWVLRGELEHRDSTGTVGVIYPGLAQRMSAGSGITHSEMNASSTADVHLVQMWVLPDTDGIAPGYEQRDLNDELASGGLVPVASGQGHDGAVTLHQRDAVLYAARLDAGAEVTIPDAPHVHLFVALGSARLTSDEEASDEQASDEQASDEQAGHEHAGDELAAGDAVRFTDAGAPQLRAGSDGAEILVWATA